MTTIQEVIQTILFSIPGVPFPDTVDTVKTGNPLQPVTGIVTTFMATADVIRKAAALGANLVITHEPTFYNHRDETSFLAGDKVYEAKRRLIEDHNIVVWRFHDYWHAHQPDGIVTGVLKKMGWETYANSDHSLEYDLPEMTLLDLAIELKTKLEIQTLRYVGNSQQVCRKVALRVGADDWEIHVQALRQDVDVLIVGEIHEWETSEYIRDALSFGMKKGLIITGHVSSEEPGMAYLVEWLKPRFPSVPVTHIPAGSPFKSL
jgi:putative NIF3 family GTP cyclohydrolase 1 type 2